MRGIRTVLHGIFVHNSIYVFRNLFLKNKGNQAEKNTPLQNGYAKMYQQRRPSFYIIMWNTSQVGYFSFFFRITHLLICCITVSFDFGCLLCCLLIAVKAVDALMETQWVNPKEGDEAFFTSRANVVLFLDRYICFCSVLIMFFVAFCNDNRNTNMIHFITVIYIITMSYVTSFD